MSELSDPFCLKHVNEMLSNGFDEIWVSVDPKTAHKTHISRLISSLKLTNFYFYERNKTLRNDRKQQKFKLKLESLQNDKIEQTTILHLPSKFIT